MVTGSGDRTCQNDTGYLAHITHADLSAGRVFWVATSDYRLSVLRILAHSADGNTIACDVRTFSP